MPDHVQEFLVLFLNVLRLRVDLGVRRPGHVYRDLLGTGWDMLAECAYV